MLETGLLVLCKKVLIFLFACTLLVNAQHFPNRQVDSLLTNGIDFIINEQYSSATEIFNVLKTQYKNLPLGNIYLAAVSIAKTADYRDSLKEDSIDDYLNSAYEMSEDLFGADELNIWNNYFLALTLAYKAYFEVMKNNYLSAFREGYQSLQYFQRCSQIDTNFYESYLAIGTYDYWKSAKLKSITWLPFVEDKREQGIKLLRSTLNRFSYNKYLALNSLLWIYIDQKEYNKAAELCLDALKKYPNSRFFMWGLARAFEDIDKKKAIDVYNKILVSLKNENKLSTTNFVILKHKLALNYYYLKSYKKALELIDEILSINKMSAYELKILEERILRAQNLKKELLDIIDSKKN